MLNPKSMEAHVSKLRLERFLKKDFYEKPQGTLAARVFACLIREALAHKYEKILRVLEDNVVVIFCLLKVKSQ